MIHHPHPREEPNQLLGQKLASQNVRAVLRRERVGGKVGTQGQGIAVMTTVNIAQVKVRDNLWIVANIGIGREVGKGNREGEGIETQLIGKGKELGIGDLRVTVRENAQIGLIVGTDIEMGISMKVPLAKRKINTGRGKGTENIKKEVGHMKGKNTGKKKSLVRKRKIMIGKEIGKGVEKGVMKGEGTETIIGHWITHMMIGQGEIIMMNAKKNLRNVHIGRKVLVVIPNQEGVNVVAQDRWIAIDVAASTRDRVGIVPLCTVDSGQGEMTMRMSIMKEAVRSQVENTGLDPNQGGNLFIHLSLYLFVYNYNSQLESFLGNLKIYCHAVAENKKFKFDS